MPHRIYFSARSTKPVNLPAYAMSCPDEIVPDIGRVAQAIARACGCDSVIGCREDYRDVDGSSVTHEVTIGDCEPMGGFTPYAQVFVTI